MPVSIAVCDVVGVQGVRIRLVYARRSHSCVVEILFVLMYRAHENPRNVEGFGGSGLKSFPMQLVKLIGRQFSIVDVGPPLCMRRVTADFQVGGQTPNLRISLNT